MKLKRTIFVLIYFAASSLYAQEIDPSSLSLERIYKNWEFRGERFGPVQWLEDGSEYTLLEDSEDIPKGKDLAAYDCSSGARTILVKSSELIPKGRTMPLSISGYSWSKNMERLLIFTNTSRVWRYNTKGDYWVFDRTRGSLIKLGGDAEPSTLMFAKFSPQGDRVGYVRENNIYAEDISTGAITQLTSDGSFNIINGTSDWVYEEELSLRDGYRWSPDGEYIAYWQFNTEGVRNFYLINNTDSLYSFTIPIQYPKTGGINSACRVGVVRSSGGKTQWFDLPGDPRNHYIARMDWCPHSNEVIIQQLNRLQNTNRLFLADADSHKFKNILIERDSAWIDINDELYWLSGGNQFTWISERDGWRHVYLVSKEGAVVNPVTSGNYDVISIESIDDKNGWLYFIASSYNPTQRYLFRIPLNGIGEAKRLTPANQEGTHSYQISSNSQYAIHSFSSFDNPPVTELITLPKHISLKTLAENTELKKRINQLKRNPVEFFRVDIGDGIELDAWCIKPPEFDASKKYPLLFYVYGEPAGQTVLDRWFGSNYLWHLMLAQKGYIIMSIDNRGTPGPRGREWRKSVYKQIGIIASKDQAAALTAIIDKTKYVDPERIGIWGWSGGGSMSLNMIFRYPDLYRTAMAIAPVSNQRYYDTIYQERYMGLPQDNEYGYKEGSPITYAHQLKGNLLLVHGTGDDNVHYQNSEALINELIKHNKKFTMMAYPNRSHSIYEGENTTLHLRELLTSYLYEHLPPGPLSEE